jgi:DNA modification methylase
MDGRRPSAPLVRRSQADDRLKLSPSYARLEHPTMQSVGLIDYPVANTTQGGEIVLDPFGGSGSR